MKKFTQFKTMQIVGVCLGRASPLIATFAVFITRTAEGKALTASDAFATLAVFQTLRIGMIFIPLSITMLVAVLNNIRRTESYCSTDEPEAVSRLPASDENAAVVWGCEARWTHFEDEQGDPEQPLATHAGHEQGDAEQPVADVPFTLNVPELVVPRGTILAVVGHVASGKSMLLDTLLGGGPVARAGARLAICDSVGFVPQEALIVSGTIRENVLMGRPFDKRRFDWAIETAAMQRDLKILPHAEETVVGERGTTLSGGQQQRVSIARAVYGEPDLIVADDPVSAVDAVVARTIFENLSAYVRADSRRSALLVLNQLQLLKDCDEVAYLDQGRVVATGTFDTLSRTSAQFQTYASSFLNKQDEVEEEDGELEASVDASSAAADPGSTDSQQVVVKETRASGAVSLQVFSKWVRLAGAKKVAGVAVLMACSYVCLGLNDLWLARWTSAVDEGKVTGGSWFYCGIFVALSSVMILLNLTSCVIFVELASNASRSLHRQCLITVISSPLRWFESMPSGRILSRFGADLVITDIQFGLMLDGVLQMSMSLLLIMAVISYTNIFLLIACAVALPVYAKIIFTNFKSLRESRRIQNNALSPVVTNVAEAVRGRLLGRSIRCSSFFIERHTEYLDDFLKASYVSSALMVFNSLLTSFLSVTISSITGMFCLLTNAMDPALTGIALTYAFLLPYFFMVVSDLTVRARRGGAGRNAGARRPRAVTDRVVPSRPHRPSCSGFCQLWRGCSSIFPAAACPASERAVRPTTRSSSRRTGRRRARSSSATCACATRTGCRSLSRDSS